MRNKLSTKILSTEKARQWAAQAHRKRLKIVATNGCFDILHYGHVSYLQRARNLGDLLVIGLNSDSSVRTLKGPHRPLVPEKQRAAVLAALECVDAVVIFRQPRAHQFLSAVRPDIYVKAGDYQLDTLDPTEREVLESLGAKIQFLPFIPGFSTTGLIKKIQAAHSL